MVLARYISLLWNAGILGYGFLELNNPVKRKEKTVNSELVAMCR